MKKIVITGATGVLAREIVPQLLEHGSELLLCSRDTDRVRALFPNVLVCGYDNLVEAARGYDVLVHLAVANNDEALTDKEFEDTNVVFLKECAEKAKAAGIGRFMNISSTHALDETNTTAYASSKRRGSEALKGLNGIEIDTTYLPAVYGRSWPDKLQFLNRLPITIARWVFVAAAAFKPTVNSKQLVSHILSDPIPSEDHPHIISDSQIQNPIYLATKRFIDLTFAILVLIFLGWILVLICIGIRLDSKGPALFIQERVGQGGRVFKCYKLRTMQVGTKQTGTHEVSEASVTRLGHFLRKAKIDELPQIWNILRNELSLVGPRPCLPVQEVLVEARRRHGIHDVKPGISGLAQVNGIDMSVPETLARWDAKYIALSSISLDLKIIIATVGGRGNGDNIRNADRTGG